jgi:hypothetical protein
MTSRPAIRECLQNVSLQMPHHCPPNGILNERPGTATGGATCFTATGDGFAATIAAGLADTTVGL